MSFQRSFSNNRSNRGGGNRFGGGRPQRFARGGRRQPTFDPTFVIQNTRPRVQEEKVEYVSVNRFVDFEIDHQLKENVLAKGYTQPTPIQDQAIPHILEGKDLVGVANTGTGKTAAFLIPLIHKLLQNPEERVLITTPTRELALQIRDEFSSFSQGMPLRAALCIGGASMFRQIEQLRRRPQIVIGTPGRLKDLEQRRKLNFQFFSTIVLDEVDRMLDMGFIHDVRHLIECLPAQRHSLFFSATMNDNVRNVMRSFLTDPVTVTIKSRSTSENVKQEVVKISGRSKVDVLHDMLNSEEFQKVLVFGRTKWGIEGLTEELNNRGFKVASIHGNKSQGQRQRAIRDFKENQVQVLLATDVVSRGLDIDNVTHVINYDLPQSYEDYIHRIGRTGRAEKTGIALTFVE